ncbi:MAG: hypothetical protein P8X50_05755 [Maritimibacter sp.]|jgi:hypothetical protein
MRKLTLVPLAAMAFLAACAGADINQPPVDYIPTQTLNEVGTTSFTVRTYSRAGGERNELSGVSCKFQGKGFHSSFVTPAVVAAPNMQLRTPPASVTCTYNGVTKTQVLKPYNKTLYDIEHNGASIGANAGLLGAIIGGAIASASASKRDTSVDVWAYHDARVEFGQ